MGQLTGITKDMYPPNYHHISRLKSNSVVCDNFLWQEVGFNPYSLIHKEFGFAVRTQSFAFIISISLRRCPGHNPSQLPSNLEIQMSLSGFLTSCIGKGFDPNCLVHKELGFAVRTCCSISWSEYKIKKYIQETSDKKVEL